jgi:hypothetical protein
MTLKYNHLIETDEENRRLTIHRIYDNGRKELFTQVDLPNNVPSENEAQLESFFQLLGENLILDSPIARKLLGL